MWKYNGEEFTSDMIGDHYGFVYKIINKKNGKVYIGRKYFWSKRTLPPLKGKKRKRHVVKESDWKTYWGSCKSLKDDIKQYGKESFERIIVSLHPDKTETNYHEMKLQFLCDVLESRDENGDRVYYNENINCKFYPRETQHSHRQSIRTQYLTEELDSNENIQSTST